MNFKVWTRICKGIAIAQAVAAPTLMVVGTVKNLPKMQIFGGIWCGLIALDTGRTSWHAIDNELKVYGLTGEDKVVFY